MKVLLVSRDCQVGGVETFTLALAQALARRRVECELFFFEDGPLRAHLPAHVPARFGDLAACHAHVRRGRFDVVHASSSDWQHGVAALRAGGARLVVTSHGWVVPAWNSTNCDAVVACSEWQAREQRRSCDLPVRTVLNGIDTGAFSPAAEGARADQLATRPWGAQAASDAPVVAWVGRGRALVQKRIYKLAEIAPALRGAGLRLWIADPYGPAEVEKVAPEAARVLREAAEFWGGVGREEMPDFYRAVAASGGCVLSTASFEGLPLALAEAQACACPVVASDVRGNDEVVDPARGGVLYPFDLDAARLAALITGTVADAGGMRRRGEESARMAREQFGIERMADEYLSVYREALDGAPRTSAAARARQWLAPAVAWGEYVEHRWAAGRSLHAASRLLAERGDARAAAELARLSFVTAPTIYARPARLAYLLKAALAGLRSKSLRGGDGLARAGAGVAAGDSRVGPESGGGSVVTEHAATAPGEGGR